MAKIILIDDFGTEETIDFDTILLKSNPHDSEAQRRLMKSLEDLPAGELRSGVLAAMRDSFVLEFFLDRLFVCHECERIALDKNFVFNDEEDTALCKECASK